MTPSKIWFVAIAGALAGAVSTHVLWLLQEEERAPPARFLSEESCEPRVERVCPGIAPAGPAARNVEQAETARVEPPFTPTPPPISPPKPLDWNPIAQLSPEQRKIMVRQRYGALLRELALSSVQTERLMHVLSEQEARNSFGMRGFPGVPAQESEAAAGRARGEIAAAIGDDKAAAFEQLREAMPLRAQLRGLRDQLEQAGEPMTNEQFRALSAALTTRGPERPPEGESREEAAELYRDWMNEREDMLRESAAKVLDSAQLKTLDESHELREAMRSQLGASFEARRAQARSGG